MEVRRRVRHARRHLAPAAWRWCMLLSFAVGVQPSMVLQTQWEPGSESPQDICASADLELPTLEARVHRSHSRTASLSHRLEVCNIHNTCSQSSGFAFFLNQVVSLSLE